MQQPLWHESLEDAIDDIVSAVGGPKKLASKLWPDKPIADAARLLRHCLDPERPEKLDLSQLMFILREGRAVGCHTAMYFIATELNYEPPKPVEPETEQQRLMREFIDATNRMAKLTERMHKRGVSVQGLS